MEEVNHRLYKMCGGVLGRVVDSPRGPKQDGSPRQRQAPHQNDEEPDSNDSGDGREEEKEERKVQMVDQACSPLKEPDLEPERRSYTAEYAQSEALKSQKRLKQGSPPQRSAGAVPNQSGVQNPPLSAVTMKDIEPQPDPQLGTPHDKPLDCSFGIHGSQ